MNKRITILLLVAILSGTILSACERSVTGPVEIPTATSEVPFPVNPQPSVVVPTQPNGAKNPEPTQGGQEQPTQPNIVVNTPVPTQAPQIVVPSPTPGRPATYTVQQGDHYICLARRYNLDLNDFFQLNGLNMNSLAVVGKVVKVPSSGSWSDAYGPRSLKKHPATYSVQAGDTIYKVACGFGDVDPNAIVYANSLKSPYTLTAGQTLQIP